MALLQWLESTPFSVWLRESPSIWAYPTVLFLHTVGLSFSVGPSVAMDLRLIGFARRLPISPLAGLFKVIWIAFLLNAASGIALLAANATTRLTNPVFYLKMIFVFAAMTVMVVMRRQVFANPAHKPIDEGAGRFLAVASILCWFGAVTAGRFMTYFASTGTP